MIQNWRQRFADKLQTRSLSKFVKPLREILSCVQLFYGEEILLQIAANARLQVMRCICRPARRELRIHRYENRSIMEFMPLNIFIANKYFLWKKHLDLLSRNVKLRHRIRERSPENIVQYRGRDTRRDGFNYNCEVWSWFNFLTRSPLRWGSSVIVSLSGCLS